MEQGGEFDLSEIAWFNGGLFDQRRSLRLDEGDLGLLVAHVLPEREKNRRDAYRERWWRHVEPRPAMLANLSSLTRYIATPRVAKHRLFVWMEKQVLADSAAIAIARGDAVTFGLLHSRFHETWSLKMGTFLGVGNDPRYTPTTTFETFPFPEGLTPDIPAQRYQRNPRAIAIAATANRLDALRNAWLNPADLVFTEPEVVAGYPDRVLPKDVLAAAALRERTLTNLYNLRPQWLIDAHDDLDAAVALAYGWPADISEEAALAKLLELNLERESVEEVAASRPAKRRSKGRTVEDLRTQPELLLPIAGGQAIRPSIDKAAVDRENTGESKQKNSTSQLRRPA
ncbi:type IIL restriction-modification enzyme MmeI [Agrobacterium sp. NPDC090283]|uniref:type IIL restriction-modification enzyme MmeI n=1 Tax=Agrobacterium sp. NPDC090283 TaxID=3363920 RepID=UPI00383A9C2A